MKTNMALPVALCGFPWQASPMIEAQDRPLSAGEVAKRFGVNPATVTRWADEGKLPSFRTPGRHRRFRAADVAALLRGEHPAA